MKVIPRQDLIELLKLKDSELIYKDSIENLFELLGDTYYINDGHTGWELCEENSQRKDILCEIKEEPKPVIKAKWETGFTFPDGEYWRCTSCKEIIKVRAGAMNFCGHCGAQMEREK